MSLSDEDWVGFRVAKLQDVLDASGSAWAVGRDEDEGYCLQRRLDATIEQTAREEMGQPGRAAGYLRRAWSNVYGRTPDPSVAYGEAVRAVEAAARLVITPTDEVATLGKMVAAMRDKPEKWETVIGDVKTVRKMMGALWFSQRGRHGTDRRHETRQCVATAS